jgi:hypothetical protein
MTKPTIAKKGPYAVDVEEGKKILLVCLRVKSKTALL